MLRLSEVECGQDERPVEDVTLKSIEVLWNPFDDIIPRQVCLTYSSHLVCAVNDFFG